MSRLPHPYRLDDAYFYLREVVPHELAWAVTSGAGGRLMGFAGVVPDASGRSADLGYWLGRPYWGQGFATEASEAIIGHMFGALALPFLTSGCFEDNVASRRVLEKTGFVAVGRGVRACLALG